MKKLSRRETLSRLGGAALCLAVRPAGAADPLAIGGRPVELVLTPTSGRTLRVSLLPIADDGPAKPIAADPAIVASSSAPPIVRTRAIAGAQSFDWGQLRVKVSNGPLAISIEDRSGKSIQRLQFDSATGAISFRNSAGPVFGLGEGGPLFDRRNQQ